MPKEVVFFAYQSSSKSGTSDNVDAIKNAVIQLNQGDKFHVRTWEDLQNNGRVLVKAICEAIDQYAGPGCQDH